ncbi:TPA: ABC-2 family transporter protein, partial [Burkholderia multivorans]|nr:ABC-2 family transporter protein [Burkholderia multivorans]
FLGGAIIPPSYWPAFIRPLMAFNPFQYYIAAPATLIIGGDLRAGAAELCVAMLYILMFVLVIRTMWRHAVNTYTGGGG